MARPGAGRVDRVAVRKARLERHAAETDPEVVLNAAARFLEARQRSVGEVRRHLAEARYPEPLIERAVERLLELHWLDDETFARSWVESRDRAHPRGTQALRRELALKGIDRETVEAVLAERDSDGGARPAAIDTTVETQPGASADELAARRLLERKGSGFARLPDLRLRRQRAYALLARNGFDADVCRDVSAAFVRDGAPADED